MRSSRDAPERARRLTFKVLADTIAEHGCFGTPLHRLALKAMRSRDVEAEVWEAIERLDDETRQRLLARLQQIHANAPAVAREYVTRGLG